MLYNLNSTTNAAYFRYSLDGELTWIEIRQESKDIFDIIPSSMVLISNHVEGAKEIVFQARKENASDTLDIIAHNIIFEKKA